MRDHSFMSLIKEMTPMQRSVCNRLEESNADLIWYGGKVDTWPLRVSVKNREDQSLFAINTRQKKKYLRLEFRSIDYDGEFASPTQHLNFDRYFDFVDEEDVEEDISVASKIISTIKMNYKT